ncbi:hypothetical protein Lal_00046245 [Lupinus albus]|nr:hypothetical protein Lal_00046245 [Lupinus albus]
MELGARSRVSKFSSFERVAAISLVVLAVASPLYIDRGPDNELEEEEQLMNIAVWLPLLLFVLIVSIALSAFLDRSFTSVKHLFKQARITLSGSERKTHAQRNLYVEHMHQRIKKFSLCNFYAKRTYMHLAQKGGVLSESVAPSAVGVLKSHIRLNEELQSTHMRHTELKSQHSDTI